MVVGNFPGSVVSAGVAIEFVGGEVHGEIF